ncbi:vps-28 [Pristionchus pacificus]|uniref:Vacuolar protein sorting-associated protein 28 homolog n=1 Tax=Pristionchus pacificus TaxID=54126 RepID=A0A2A6CCP6_PRIPA|nr:vps-28 [Pristionchus pacificus]|eukprot:PDM75899.1 vps-28 [Pristionchus pacificus]
MNRQEIRLYENNAEREQMDNLGELFAVLNALEHLEKMFARDYVPHDAYKTECFKLLDQYKVAMRVVRGADAESFAQKYRLHCPAALERIRDGRPIEAKDDRGNAYKNIAFIVERFITALDCLRLETRDVDNLFPNISDLYSAINAMSSLPADFNGRIKVKKWFDKLSVMAATDVITEDERRQAVLDLEQSYNEFTEFLNR